MADSDVMEGGPDGSEMAPEGTTESGTGTASPDSTSSPGGSPPGMQEVEIGGQRFAVSEAMATAIKAEQENYGTRISDLQTGLEAAKRAEVPSPSAREPDPAVSSTVGTYNWETKLFENPTEAVQEIVKLAKEEATAELTTAYQRAEAAKKATEDFWNGFYEKNDHLKGKEEVVQFVVNRDQDLAALSLDDAAKEIKERTEKFLKGIGASIPSGGKPPIVEGGPEKAPETTPAAPAQADRPGSLGDVLRNRAKQRAEGRHTLQAVK